MDLVSFLRRRAPPIKTKAFKTKPLTRFCPFPPVSGPVIDSTPIQPNLYRYEEAHDDEKNPKSKLNHLLWLVSAQEWNPCFLSLSLSLSLWWTTEGVERNGNARPLFDEKPKPHAIIRSYFKLDGIDWWAPQESVQWDRSHVAKDARKVGFFFFFSFKCGFKILNSSHLKNTKGSEFSKL